MSHELPSYLEDYISQIAALQLLQNLDWNILTPEESVSLRGGRLSGVILDEKARRQIWVRRRICAGSHRQCRLTRGGDRLP